MCTVTPLTCNTIAVLQPGASYPPITVTASIAATASGTLVNNATVGGGGETNLANDNATDSISVATLPDMTIVKSHTGIFTRGGTGTYNLLVSNVGGSQTVGTVSFVDTLPTGLTATAISGGSTWTCTLSPLGCSTTTVLAAGASYPPVTLTVAVAGNIATSVTNVAVVSGGGETNLTNDTSSDPTSFTGNSPDLVLSKIFCATSVANGAACPSSAAIQGGTGFYEITVTNDGTGPTTGTVTVMDPMAVGLTPTGISGVGWNCSISALQCTRTDALAPGASFPPVEVAVNIAPNAPASIQNIASTLGGGATPTSAGSAASTVPVAGVTPTITVIKSSDRSSAIVGDVIGYTVIVNNMSLLPYTNDVVNDILPSGFVYVAGSARLTIGTATPQPIDPGTNPGTLVFNLGTMAGQQIDTITYRVRVGGSTRMGSNVNKAQFMGTGPNGLPAASSITGYGVMISSNNLFTQQQFLIGRVFEDTNGNGAFDKGEKPFAGVRIYISNGMSASTDSQGLYNIPSIAPGSVVVSLDPATVPKGYTISSGGRLDAEDWSRLVRTPLQGGAMLRQNFALKKCPNCVGSPGPTPPPPPPVTATATSTKPAGRIEIIPQQESIPADGRSTMTVNVRVYDEDGKLVPAKEIRVRASAGQFVAATDSTIQPGTPPAGVKPTETNILGSHTKPQLGATTEQVPETQQAGMAKNTQGEATFRLMAPSQPGTAELVAESGDPDHLLRTTMEISYMPEKRTPILVTDGEVSVGRAAPDLISYGQDKTVVRHADAFLRTPLGDDFLMTLAYTSHLTINASNGNPGLFQLDPLDRVYQVFGDSSTQYQLAQSNSHVYGRLDHGLSYLLFGDIRMGINPGNTAPTPASQSFNPQAGISQQNAYGVGDYNRNVVGAAIHFEDKNHNSLTLEGARPNTAFARDVFAGFDVRADSAVACGHRAGIGKRSPGSTRPA